ncbi:Hypothetical predicted protein [Cloeon dipterum]|uniref:Uncharacterized protein n=1 Tax=Cloeon dipterum TaxID=197152 RepID=A0A8S1E1N3_9INSE|nr:Hypothetical predicted protein [Cloeon dipterum]
MNNIKVKEENPENSGTSRKRKHEPQTPREETKMKLDEQYEKWIKTKLRFVEKNKGDLPALHFAARVSDVDVCRRLVQQGANVNEKCGVLGAIPLHYAALNQAHGEGIINFLVGKGCDIDTADAHHDKAINYATQAGNYKSATRLYIHSKIPYSREATINSWLHFCIKQNLLQFAKKVYNDFKSEDILWKYPYNRFCILETACKVGDLEMCKWLLEEVEIDVNQFEENDWKDKVLEQVARNRKNEASKILGYLFSRLDAAKFVHEKDGDLINEVNEDGATILHLAAKFGDVKTCQWLIDLGQDLYATNKQTFANFLHDAAQNRWFGHSIIQIFGHNLRGYVNAIDENVYTPLHYALFNEIEHQNVAETLLELGADLSVKRKGNNFLHFCIVMGKIELAKFVHAKDKNLIKEKGEGGKTTLHIAADNFDEEICAWLVKEEGADPQEITVGGKSVLESTSSKDAKKFLQSLITTNN